MSRLERETFNVVCVRWPTRLLGESAMFVKREGETELAFYMSNHCQPEPRAGNVPSL